MLSKLDKRKEQLLEKFTVYTKAGKNITPVMKELNLCRLQIAEELPFKVNIKLFTKGCCPECEKLNGRVIPIEEAFKTLPLPYHNCTREQGCFCMYLAEPEAYTDSDTA